VSPEDFCVIAALSEAHSRRSTFHAGGALLAGLAALVFQRSAAQATQVADAGEVGCSWSRASVMARTSPRKATLAARRTPSSCETQQTADSSSPT